MRVPDHNTSTLILGKSEAQGIYGAPHETQNDHGILLNKLNMCTIEIKQFFTRPSFVRKLKL